MKAFATVGTTRFDDLVFSLLGDEETQTILISIGITELIVQTGNSELPSHIAQLKGLKVDSFAFNTSLSSFVSDADLIISHAGAGSCLEALYAKKPLVVVVNSTLMNDHQTELATKLESDGHIVKCSMDKLKETLANFDEEKRSQLVEFEQGDPQLLAQYINNLFADSIDGNRTEESFLLEGRLEALAIGSLKH